MEVAASQPAIKKADPDAMPMPDSIVDLLRRRFSETRSGIVLMSDGAHADIQELEEHVRRLLTHFKIPQDWTFVDQFSMTGRGISRKFEFARMFGKTESGHEV